MAEAESSAAARVRPNFLIGRISLFFPNFPTHRRWRSVISPSGSAPQRRPTETAPNLACAVGLEKAQQLRHFQRFRRSINALRARRTEIGRASCRERVCQYIKFTVVAVSIKKKQN